MKSTVGLVLILSFLVLVTTSDVASDAGVPPNLDVGAKPDAIKIPSGGEKFEFQAEVGRLMNIIVNSLYSNREIFLRELVSNAADALEKIRFLSVTNPKLLGDGDLAELDIRIRVDDKAKTLEITDKGVGMTKEELVKNLGTIAKSGTSSFLEKISKDADGKDLIGQFGVGFYSSYLVADTVRVISKSNEDDKQHVWVSSAQQSFTVFEDKDGEQLGRGTRIVLHLKDDAAEYLKTDKIKDLIKKYSQFVAFPIYVETVTTVEEDEPEEGSEEEKKIEDDKSGDKESEDEESADNDDDEEVKVEEGDEDAKKAPKKKKVEKRDWEKMNEEKPLWIRDPSDISEEEYTAFFKHISKEWAAPRSHIHFKTEGGSEFRSILYIPDKLPMDAYNKKGPSDNIKLYIRRVLVQDAFDQSLLPSYLAFIKGIVDSDDIPINVSREMLQASKVLDAIRKKLIRKALEMIRNLMVQEPPKKEDEDEESEDDKDVKKAEKPHPYISFWKEFGNTLKWGIVEDHDNRDRLTKLMRFKTTRTETEDENDWVSLEKYVERMKDGQKAIYYLAGESIKQVRDSPFLEKLNEKGYEVILFTDAIDEYVMQHLKEHDGFKFMDISKENFKFAEDDQKDEKEKLDTLKKSFKPLTKFIKDHLKKGLARVQLSTRLASAPCAIVSSEWGYSARMETIMRAQALAQKTSFVEMPKVMEINPMHPVIRALGLLVKEDPDSEKAKETVELLYDTALVSSGFYISDNKGFQTRMQQVMRSALGVDPSEPLSSEPLFDDSEVEDDDEDEAKPEADSMEEEDSPFKMEEVDPAEMDKIKARMANKEDAVSEDGSDDAETTEEL